MASARRRRPLPRRWPISAFRPRPVDLRPLPFEGTWGLATSAAYGLANEAVMRDLEASGQLEGLSKKEAKALASGAVRERVPVLASQIAERVAASGNPIFGSVEAVNGYVNIAFDGNAVAAALIGEVLARGADYGQGDAIAETVMVEHSQPNTHKAFHVGHLRNSVLGVAISNILRAAGYPVQDANYIGDIGMHVIKCLWCYEHFHQGEEPAIARTRGRWLGEIYAESDARLNYRKDVLDFLQLLSQEDQQFVAAIDRLLKFLWRKGAEGEDIAYLLGPAHPRAGDQGRAAAAGRRHPQVLADRWRSAAGRGRSTRTVRPGGGCCRNRR